MSKGLCAICGEEIPPHPETGAAYCIYVRSLIVSPSQFENRTTTYEGLWIHHICWQRITSNIANSDTSTNNGY